MPREPNDLAWLFYTSGTTGRPKGALHAHRVLLGHLPGVEFPQEFFPAPGDRFWTPADWAWIKCASVEAEQARDHLLVGNFMPAYDRLIQNHFEVIACRRVAATALALRWYAVDHQKSVSSRASRARAMVHFPRLG